MTEQLTEIIRLLNHIDSGQTTVCVILGMMFGLMVAAYVSKD